MTTARPARVAAALCAALLALLAGCATRPSGLPSDQRDGPDARPPPGLELVPDAEPRIEPLRIGGPNKPYEVLGQRYVPGTDDLPLEETGLASWYGRKFHGRPTSSGEPYDMYAMTAAHKTMPIPSYARVRNPANGRSIIVRVNDRGPFAPGRVIDLSYTAALKLGLLGGVAPVQVTRLTHTVIAAGGWRTAPAEAVRTASVAAPAAAANAPGLVAVPAAAIAPVAFTPPPMPPRDAATAALPPEDPIAAFAAMADDPAPGDRPRAAGDWWLQLAAFRSRDAALRLQQRALAEAAAPGVAVVEEAGHHRVQAGPYASRAQATAAAAELERRLAMPPAQVLRRESPSSLGR